MTQQDLAVRAGLALRTVARIEGREGAASVETYLAIASALDMTLSELIESAA